MNLSQRFRLTIFTAGLCLAISAAGQAQCPDSTGKYTWTACCTGTNSSNVCPASGSGPCQISLGESGLAPTATPSIACVDAKKTTTIEWSTGAITAGFVVEFGTGTGTPFGSTTVVVGTNTPEGATLSDTAAGPYEYYLAYCSSGGQTNGQPCVTSDPKVIIAPPYTPSPVANPPRH